MQASMGKSGSRRGNYGECPDEGNFHVPHSVRLQMLFGPRPRVAYCAGLAAMILTSASTSPVPEPPAIGRVPHRQWSRRAFAIAIARLKVSFEGDADTEATALRILGAPDDVMTSADNDVVPEGWRMLRYGTEGHGSLGI